MVRYATNFCMGVLGATLLALFLFLLAVGGCQPAFGQEKEAAAVRPKASSTVVAGIPRKTDATAPLPGARLLISQSDLRKMLLEVAAAPTDEEPRGEIGEERVLLDIRSLTIHIEQIGDTPVVTVKHYIGPYAPTKPTMTRWRLLEIQMVGDQLFQQIVDRATNPGQTDGPIVNSVKTDAEGAQTIIDSVPSDLAKQQILNPPRLGPAGPPVQPLKGLPGPRPGPYKEEPAKGSPGDPGKNAPGSQGGP